MTRIQIVLCLTFAGSLAFGQVAFKSAAEAWRRKAEFDSTVFSFISPQLIGAFLLYGATAFLWLYILRDMSLSRAYTFSLLGSAIVPIMAFLIFHEPLTARFFVGFVLVLFGVFLCVR
jgi:drug/metabolite transporter (DMT)-like permease